MFEPEVFRKHIEESSLLKTLLGLFGALRSDLAPGELCPFVIVPLCYAPG